ncbi:MAG: carboxypeptidase-like regulatory domain-containing protein [Clostridiaceae bacterium]
MAKIYGKVKDTQGTPLANAEILFIDRGFALISSGYSDDDGAYYVQVNESLNGMLSATCSYGEKYLGAWFMNLNSNVAHQIDLVLGTVEFVFFKREIMKDSKDFNYSFRLVSLDHLKERKANLSPEFDLKNFTVTIDKKPVNLFELTKRGTMYLEDKRQNVDEYLLKIENTGNERGKLLELHYHDGEHHGVIQVNI